MVFMYAMNCLKRPQYVDGSGQKDLKKVPKRPKENLQKWQKISTQDSNVVPHRSTSWARRCLTSLSEREAVFSSLYGRFYF